MDPIPFLFVPGGIDWAVTFSPPVIDLHPETPPAPPPRDHCGTGAVHAEHRRADVHRLCVARSRRTTGRRADKTDRRLDAVRARRDVLQAQGSTPLGHLEARSRARPGRLRSGCASDTVEIVDIAPNDVESFLKCLLRMVLDAALDADGAAPRGTGAGRVLTDAGPRSRDRGRPGEGLRRGVNDGRDHCSSRRDRRERPCRRGPRGLGTLTDSGTGNLGPFTASYTASTNLSSGPNRPDRSRNRAHPEPAGGLDRGHVVRLRPERHHPRLLPATHLRHHPVHRAGVHPQDLHRLAHGVHRPWSSPTSWRCPPTSAWRWRSAPGTGRPRRLCRACRNCSSGRRRSGSWWSSAAAGHRGAAGHPVHRSAAGRGGRRHPAGDRHRGPDRVPRRHPVAVPVRARREFPLYDQPQQFKVLPADGPFDPAVFITLDAVAARVDSTTEDELVRAIDVSP